MPEDFDLFGAIDKEEEKGSITEADIEVISKLGEKQKHLESTNFDEKEVKKTYELLKDLPIALIETAAKMCKDDLRIIKEDYLPNAMDSIGMAMFELKDGGKIEIKKGISVNLKNENKTAFYDWVIKKGFQDLIKNHVVVQFPKEGRKSSKRFIKYLNRYYANKGTCVFTEKEDIHSQTLKKFIKGLMEEGKKLPDKLIKIHEYKTTKII